MNILAATKERAVFDVLGNQQGLKITAALDTGRIYQAIPTTQLAIIDYDELVAQPFAVEMVQKLLTAASVEQCSAAEFMAASDNYLSGRKGAPRGYELPQKRTIAFTSYSGGTGKTSLSLDTALYFVRQTRKRLQLPAAVMEFTYGCSALQTLAAGEQPFLSELIGQPEREPYDFQGVHLYPMDYEAVRLMPPEQVSQYFRQQIGNHVLTIIDSSWPHGLSYTVGEEVDLWIVLSTPRIDAIENALKLRDDLALRYGQDKVVIAMNQMGGFSDSLATASAQADIKIKIPRAPQSAGFFDGRLGKEVLAYLYDPLWQAYERQHVGLFKKKA